MDFDNLYKIVKRNGHFLFGIYSITWFSIVLMECLLYVDLHIWLYFLFPGRGSPRTSQSPFGNSPDPTLMSPHSISPNNSLRQPNSSQISPQYNQSSIGAISSLSPVQSMNPGINSIANMPNNGYDFDLLDSMER